MENEKQIILNALQNAKMAMNDFYVKNGDRDLCGFAWAEVTEYQGKKIRSNSKIGKLLLEMGFTKDYTGKLIFWNPGCACVQSLNVIEAGAKGMVKVLKENGFTARVGSRID